MFWLNNPFQLYRTTPNLLRVDLIGEIPKCFSKSYVRRSAVTQSRARQQILRIKKIPAYKALDEFEASRCDPGQHGHQGPRFIVGRKQRRNHRQNLSAPKVRENWLSRDRDRVRVGRRGPLNPQLTTNPAEAGAKVGRGAGRGFAATSAPLRAPPIVPGDARKRKVRFGLSGGRPIRASGNCSGQLKHVRG